jgi:hypothetical protein
MAHTDYYKYDNHPEDLKFEIHWRKTRVQPGTYVLLDNWMIARVLWDNGLYLNLVGNCKVYRRWLYAFYTRNNQHQSIIHKYQSPEQASYTRRMLWGKKSPCVIEVLLLTVFSQTLDLRQCVTAVWGTLTTNRWFKQQIVKYLNYEVIKELLMDELKKAFKEAKIEGSALLKRMVKTGDSIDKRLSQLINTGEGSAKDITELSRTIFEMDKSLVDLWMRSEEVNGGTGVYEGSPTYLEPTDYKLIDNKTNTEDKKDVESSNQ